MYLCVQELVCFGSLDVINADSIIKEHLRMRWANAHMKDNTISNTYLLYKSERATLSTFGGFEGPTEVTWGGNFLSFICLNIRSRNVKM
ncbi:hypothetical protein HID58_068810 [Brassica napus]|uniref:Uncharacterized protein n=1 Tax=Brassica napus TaxID=3708 RepID=A0ABQ7ZMC0_BRANA|nr:hypothetical protein HID58_068810 [Brassica napus]